ncbi:hypothetical protein [Corynebacterium sp. A21]|uniref:hypothetical protein n=1 Tax=Corynebacterium sp. A21 TaxID=3457318 RepID=UPI003FCF2705
MGAKDRFLNGTGKTFDNWMEQIGAGGRPIEEMSHREIARTAEGLGASAWWAQGIAVEIERHIGRRQVGETSAGTVSVSVSKTIPGEWVATFRDFVAFLATRRDDLPGELLAEPVISETEKWRYWKAKLSDGSTVAINCSDVSNASKSATKKACFSIEHDALGHLNLREPLKDHWRKILTAFEQRPVGEQLPQPRSSQ